MSTRITPCLAIALVLCGSVRAEEEPAVNYVRESARFVTTGNFGSDNAIDVFATEDGKFAVGLPFAEFVQLFNAAWREGRGGIVDFDNPVFGSPYVDYDRTRVKAFIEQEVRAATAAGVNFDLQPDLQAFIDGARQRAIDAGLVDFSRRGPVINRNDPSLDDPSIRPQEESIRFERLVAVYGLRREQQLVARRGPLTYAEGNLATLDWPAAEHLSTVNDTYFWEVRRPTYGNPVPISLPNSLNNGITDLLFDPRDNITAVGFTMLSANNFQYWQGLGAEPDRPNNMRVKVSFSDGTTELLTATTRQSSGGWDIFFAIQAPEGTSITRLMIRVVGRNWRTFTFMDDFAFVTEPALPFIASSLTASGSVGAPFYYRLLAGKNPDRVEVSGLPAGLSFDPVSRLISGIPSAEGTYTVGFQLENAVGVVDESIEITVLPAVAAGLVPEITNKADLGGAVTLGRDLVPIRVATSLDETAMPGELQYFTVVYRLAQDGSRTLSALEATGIGFTDGVFTGRPLQPGQVGSYVVEIHVANAFGGDRAEMILDVFPVVPVPNFDGDAATDILWRDRSSNRVYTLESSTSFLEPVPGGPSLLSRARDTGLAGTAVLFGDLDANNQADLLVMADGAPQLDLLYFLEDTTRPRTIAELSADWRPVMAGDLRGDGFVSVLWRNSAGDRWVIWHLIRDDLAWAGFLFNEGVVRELVLDADFTGTGVRDLLFRKGPNLYELVTVELLTGTGTVQLATESFRMPSVDWQPHMATDLSGEGVDDLLWKNTRTGQVSVWIMNGASVPEDARVPLPEDDGTAAPAVVEALPGSMLLPISSPFEVVTALDVNEDQRNDLVLLDRRDRSLLLMRMDGAHPAATPVALTGPGSPFDVVAAGDYNASKREDLLVHDRQTGLVQIWYLGPDGLEGTLDLGSAAPGGVEFISARTVSMDAAPPPASDDPLPPWQGAEALGGRWFHLPWFGVFHNPVPFWAGAPSANWIYHFEHRFLLSQGDDANDLWLYDPVLGWFWTSPAAYPWLFHGQVNFWIYYEPGSSDPRYLFFPGFGWLTEDEFVAFFL